MTKVMNNKKLEFNKALAAVNAKKHCKGCWGRGFIIGQHSLGFPIVNQKYDSNGNIYQYGSEIYQFEDYCTCSRKRIEKLQDELEEELKYPEVSELTEESKLYQEQK